MHASLDALPGFFLVSTSRSRAEDGGCPSKGRSSDPLSEAGKDRCPGGMQKRKNQDAYAFVMCRHSVARLSKEMDRERGGIGGETAGDVPCPTSLLRVVYSHQEPPCQRDRSLLPPLETVSAHDRSLHPGTRGKPVRKRVQGQRTALDFELTHLVQHTC